MREIVLKIHEIHLFAVYFLTHKNTNKHFINET